MSDIDKAYATQLTNIETRYGKTLVELCQLLASTGLTKHGELLAHLKTELGFSHGDANAVAHGLGIGQVVHSRAVIRAVVFLPVLHEQTFHLIALLQ